MHCNCTQRQTEGIAASLSVGGMGFLLADGQMHMAEGRIISQSSLLKSICACAQCKSKKQRRLLEACHADAVRVGALQSHDAVVGHCLRLQQVRSFLSWKIYRIGRGACTETKIHSVHLIECEIMYLYYASLVAAKARIS